MIAQQTAGYNTTATATRKRRQAAGRYTRPTAAQDAAFRRYISPRETLQAGDLAQLATHPWLTAGQRAEFATKLYWQGFNAYCDGQTLEQQATREERNGWFWALNRQSECEAQAAH